MPDQNMPPDQLGSIRQESEADIASKDTLAAVTRVREAAGMPTDADQEILEHFDRVVQREIQENGESDTWKRWERRREAPESWKETEAKLTSDMIVKARRYRESPKVPAGDPRHADKRPLDLMRMSDRDWQRYKEDQLAYAESRRK